MSRKIQKITLLFLFLFPFFIPSYLVAEVETETQTLTEKERAWVSEHPNIVVANELDWPPFDYSIDSVPLGYTVDLVRIAAKKVGLTVSFVNGVPWSELFDRFKAGEIDVLPAVYVSDERKEFMRFTQGYYSHPSVIVVHKDNKTIKDFSDLAGKRVAGIIDFVITDTLRKHPSNITVVPVAGITDALKSVSLGESDAYIDSIGVITYRLENSYVPNVEMIRSVSEEAIANPDLHMGVKKDDVVLYSILEKALSSITNEEKRRLHRRWLTFSSTERRMTMTADQRDWVSKHPVIRVGFDATYAPYSYTNSDGEYVGVAPDVLEVLGAKIGVKFEAVPNLVWTDIINGTRSNVIDIIATAVKTTERQQFLNFTPAYIPTPLVIMALRDSAISGPMDLDGLRVALVRSYSASDRVMAEHPTISPEYVNSALEGLRAVATGRADAYVGVLGVNVHLSRINGIVNLKVAGGYDLQPSGQRIAVRSDWPELTVLLSEALESIAEDEMNAIFDKWIVVSKKEVVDYSLALKISLVFFVILIVLYFYNRRLSREITLRRSSEYMLLKLNEKLQDFDWLTALPNREKFLQTLDKKIIQSQKGGLCFSLLLIDLDLFKDVNDTLGHDHGDQLLIEVAQRIISSVDKGTVIARLGGDEFVIIVSYRPGDNTIEGLISELLAELSKPFVLDAESTYISASIGVSLYPDHALDGGTLLKSADQALYSAKDKGRNTYCYFDEDMARRAIERKQLIGDLRTALKDNQFVLYYQPIVDFSTRKIVKAEALIRWLHPEKGMIEPMKFIGLAEEIGLISDIGQWVFQQSVKQVKIWRKTVNKNFQISVNTSPLQYSDGSVSLWPFYLQSLGVPGNAIIAEITEGLLLNADSLIMEQFLEFSESGIQVALDDFGTGYSSLSYLREFSIDYLKIDQSFVSNLMPNSNDLLLCEAIVAMGKKLGMMVIAEGIETDGQENLLQQTGLDYGQGYLYSRPLSVEKINHLFAEEAKLV